MHTSLIIISKDELPRLRLALGALTRQSVKWGEEAELILIDDGSAAPIAPELEDLSLPIVHLRNERSVGRSASRNLGARFAHGRRLLFLDGDVLLSHDAIQAHAALPLDEMGRGAQRHLRSTRFFADPRSGIPWPGKEEKVRSLGALSAHLVTEEQARSEFEPLVKRSEAAIYPGAAPRKLYELEMAAIERNSAPRAAWMSASGHNFSIPREAFIAAGGFHAGISINEHRELALRLTREGMRIAPVANSISIHLTHREGWRDPLQPTQRGERDWQSEFRALHPRETDLMTRFWRTLARDPALSDGEKLGSLEEVDAQLQGPA